MKMLLTTIIMLASAQVMAQAAVLSGYFHLGQGETKSISMQAAYVEQVFVQAEGASRQDAMFEVWANGKPKGSIFVPGRDPSYIVTIREAIHSLEFRHVSGGAVTVHQVRANLTYGLPQVAQRPGLGGGYSASYAVEIAQRTVAVVNDLKPHANYGQLGNYLLPIRKSAARLYALGSARSSYSVPVRHALADLKSKIDHAYAYVESNFETDSLFDLTTELLTIREAIATML